MDEFIERFVGLGTFEIVSGEMYVTDPLFELDTECVSALKNVRSGRWNAAVYMVKTGGNGERISRLAVWHEDAPEPDQLRKAEADSRCLWTLDRPAFSTRRIIAIRPS